MFSSVLIFDPLNSKTISVADSSKITSTFPVYDAMAMAAKGKGDNLDEMVNVPAIFCGITKYGNHPKKG